MDRKCGRNPVRRQDRPKRKTFQGNRFTSERDTSDTSASAKKLSKLNPDFEVGVDQCLQYCIINFALFSTLQSILICKTCKQGIRFSKRNEKGLGFQLSVRCRCESDTIIPSCPQIGKAYEVNRRFVFAMRLLGVGFQGIVNFCGIMDIGKGMNKSTYYDVINHIWIATTEVTRMVFKKAVKEEQEKNEAAGNVKNRLSVSGDGSWTRRGFSSLVGLSSLVGKFSGKLIDVVVKSSICKMCEQWKGKTDDPEFESWYESHEPDCNANHEGSAGMMEVNGIIEMFERSVELHNVYYEYYIGDGDTKTFKKLKDVQPYGDVVNVQKKECVLHVKKRMFKRANDAKKQLTQARKSTQKEATKKEKGKKSVKTVSLTIKLMKELSTYYELAIRRHPDSTEDMRKAIWATYYHKISTDENPQHSMCPEGTDSWCKYRIAEAMQTVRSFKHPPPLDAQIQPFLKHIYEDLSTEDLLQRCLGANTQNNNESYNACVWHLAPKHIFAGKKIVEIAAFCAACTFNEGFQPILKVMEVMEVCIGKEAAGFAENRDNARIAASTRRSSEASKERRTEIRNQKLLESDSYEHTEGIMYGAGIAD